jgi:signal transduction histidine kinase
VKDLVKQALNTTLEVVEADAGSILLYNQDKKKLVFEYVVGPKENELTGMELDPDQGLAGATFMTGNTSVHDDVSNEETHLKSVGENIGYVTVSMVTVALKSPDRTPIGSMQILNKRSGGFNENDVKLIEIMSAHIAVAIETARLNEQARLAMVIRFIGDISHDIKNMVTPAMSGADTLKIIADDCYNKLETCVNGTETCDPQAMEIAESMCELRDIYPEMIEMITESCEAVQQRMAEISSAIKGIVSKPNFEHTDVLSIAKRVVTMLSAHGRKKGVMVSLESDCNETEAIVDPKQIYNAMYNLIFNAIDACSDGKSVILCIHCNPEGEFPEGNNMVIECRDTGPGMPEHVKMKLFTDQAISTKPMGTGLGTRIIKNVIDAHDGIIRLDSEEGKGTAIHCIIPIKRACSAI